MPFNPSRTVCADSVTRGGQNFIKHDEAAMRHLAPYRHDKSDYISNAKEQIRLQEQLLASDRASIHNQNDHAWDSIGPVTAADESGLHGEELEEVPEATMGLCR